MNRRSFFSRLSCLVMAPAVAALGAAPAAAIPPLMMVTPRPRLSAAEREVIKRKIRELMKGVKDKPLVLDGLEAETKRLVVTPRELDFKAGFASANEYRRIFWKDRP